MKDFSPPVTNSHKEHTRAGIPGIMSDYNINQAIGFAQEMAGGFVFEIGNGWVQRRIHCISGRIGTTSLVNFINGEEYLDETIAEFEIMLAGEGQIAKLSFKDFVLKDYETPSWTDDIRTLKLNLEADVNGQTLPVSVFYEVRAEDDFMRKWIQIHPCNLDGWTIINVTIENLKFREMVEGVSPQTRYSKRYENHEDNVHVDPDKVNTAEPARRFTYGDSARAVLTYWGYGEGLYFFTESLLGEESFHRPTGLVMKQRDWAPLTEGLTTGAAVIGGYSGSPEIGFKRYNEHLAKHWCVVDNKPVPVSWNTWLVTLANNRPVLSDYNRLFLLEYIELIKDAGFYDMLQLDLGWEADLPLKVDSEKFSNGLSEIARRASEAGLDMGYWINPFSSSYWKSNLESEHPEYMVPGKVSSRSGAHTACVMTEYFDYVRGRMLDLVSQHNARVIYWDGCDWNIPECTARNHDHSNPEELKVTALKRLAGLCREAREMREDLMIIGFNLPFSNHRLCALDQEQVSDTHSFPVLQSELIQRQQLFQMTWEHPYHAIRGSWYGINFGNEGAGNLTTRPLHEIIHAQMSMIGNGLAQAGGSIDFKQASSELMDFLKKLFAFRKRFEKYFDTYQHVLGFPDGTQIDGEGHIIDGKGFIVLINPTTEIQSVKLPLAEPELELSKDQKHKLSDWSGLTHGVPLDAAKVKDAPEMELVPLEVKYIGVNMEI